MRIHLAESAGFCFGVNRAVEMVEQAAQTGKQVCTLGPIIHTRHAVAHFEKMGVRVIEKAEQAYLLIPRHKQPEVNEILANLFYLGMPSTEKSIILTNTTKERCQTT